MLGKTFEEGMKAGAKPFEEKFKKQEEAVNDMADRIDKKIDDINDVTDDILNDLSSKEKKELYDLNTVVDIAKIDDTEKELLVSVLYTLAHVTDEVTEQQQSYIRAVQKYLNINNGQIIELSCIENIDSIANQKAILQTVMEFLFIKNANHQYHEKYADFFEYFNVKPKDINEIKNAIDVIYKATGLKGISEKYGYVVEEKNASVNESEDKNSNYPAYYGEDISEKCADRVNINYYVVLDKYLVYDQGGDFFRVDKKSGEEVQIDTTGILGIKVCGYCSKLFIFPSRNNITMINADTLEQKGIEVIGECCGIGQCDENVLIYCSNIENRKRFVMYDNNNDTSKVLEYLVDGENVLTCSDFILVKKQLYFIPQDSLKSMLYVFSLETSELKEVCDLPRYPYWFMSHGVFNQFKNIVFTIEKDKNYCTYLDMNDQKAIRTVVLPRRNINVFAGYDCIYYVVMDDSMAIGKYNIITGEDNIVLKSTQCLQTSDEGVFHKRTHYYMFETPQVVGKWLYYRGQTSKKIRKTSIDNVNGSSSIEVDTTLYHDPLDFMWKN